MNTQRPRIVVVDANAYWTRSLFAALGTHADILLVEPRDLRDHSARYGGLRVVTETLAQGIRRLAFPVPPRFTTQLWPLARRIVSSRIKAHGGDRPDFLVITFPEYAVLWDELETAKRVYYNYDDYAAHWPKRADSIRRLEKQVVALSDITICISDYRTRSLRNYDPDRPDRIQHVPIGVTPAFMADAVVGMEEPEVLRALPRPRAGYVGTLSYRFDFTFLAEVASARPEVSFVLGGRPPTRSEGDKTWWQGFERAQALPNVHLIGWVNHEALGRHLAAMDVLLMMYARCSFNDSACPAKLWDYLGTGRPVVANTNNPETLLWQNVIAIAGTAEDFAARLDEALDEVRSGNSERRAARLAVARDHTWDKLAQSLTKKIGL